MDQKIESPGNIAFLHAQRHVGWVKDLLSFVEDAWLSYIQRTWKPLGQLVDHNTDILTNFIRGSSVRNK